MHTRGTEPSLKEELPRKYNSHISCVWGAEPMAKTRGAYDKPFWAIYKRLNNYADPALVK